MTQIKIDIQIKSSVWNNIKNIKQFINNTTEKLIKLTELKDYLNHKNSFLELSIALVSDEQIKKINHNFRSKNKATNTLSFPFLDEKLIKKQGLKNILKNQKYLFLGDILLSLETIRKESLNSDKTFYDHLTHLILHSLLHLISYDHKNEKDAQKMESLEIEILKKLKIKNPYL